MEISRMKRVEKALNAVEVIKYESGTLIEECVDAELNDGTAISWLLDVSWTSDSWTIEASLEMSSAGGAGDNPKAAHTTHS